MTDLGKVGIVMKGNYNSANDYEELDVVNYQNGLYIAIQDAPAGTLPTDTTYWQPALANVKGMHKFNNASPYTLNIEGNTMGIVIIQNAAGGQTPGLYAYMSTGGSALVSEIKAPTSISYATSGLAMTFTSSNSAFIHGAYIYA